MLWGRQVAVLQFLLQLVPMSKLQRIFRMYQRMLKSTLGTSTLITLLLPLVVACSDDTYIATNELPEDGGVAGGGGFAGNAGAAGAAGVAGTAGVAGVAGGTAGAGTGGSTGVCTPGETKDVGSCANCGTKRQKCDANGQWGAETCEGQGACNPGDEDKAACSDPCQAKKCQNDCTWSACGLKTGAKCKYNSGTEFQCCGTDMWQFCSSTACDWFPCSPCGASSGCQNSC